MVEREGNARRARRFFLILLGFLLFQCLFLIGDRRLPLGHETASRFRLQYFFLNSAPSAGAAPLWIPGATQGTVGSWAWFEQAGMFQNVLLLAAPLYRGGSFLPLFHLGFLVEELLLLVGVWLLASRYFRSPFTVFFVAVAALGSSLWMDHAALNLLAASSLPLLLHFLHEFVETRSRKWLYLACGLTVLQMVGKPPALALLVPAAAVLYWGGRAILVGDPVVGRLRDLRWDRTDTVRTAGLLVLLLLPVGLGASQDTDQLVHAPLESRNGLKDVFTGAGLANPLQHLDFLLGFSPNLDATCFAGYLTLGFAVLALAQRGLKASFRLLTFVLGSLILLSLLSLLLVLLLPLPQPARVPLLGVPLLRLFVVFLAGCGFQGMLEGGFRNSPAPRIVAGGFLLLAILLTVFYGGTLMNSGVAAMTQRLLTFHAPPEAVSPLLQGMELFVELAGISALMAFLAGGILLLWKSGPRHAPLALGLALLVHPLDVFGWKFRMDWLKTTSLSSEAAATLALEGPAFVPRRLADRAPLERDRSLRRRPPVLPGLHDFTYGTESWLDESFWAADVPVSRAATLYWSAPVDRLIRTLPGGPAPDSPLAFPRESASASKLAGVSRDKVQFYSRAHEASSQDVALGLSLADYAGDLLLVEGAAAGPLPPLDRDERLDLQHRVAGFDADSLIVVVEDAPAGAWMSYADAWHPSWTATVNGREVPILRAHLAYKAVRLSEGRNVVEFRFRSPVRRIASVAVGMLSCLGLAWVLREVVSLARGGRS